MKIIKQANFFYKRHSSICFPTPPGFLSEINSSILQKKTHTKKKKLNWYFWCVCLSSFPLLWKNSDFDSMISRSSTQRGLLIERQRRYRREGGSPPSRKEPGGKQNFAVLNKPQGFSKIILIKYYILSKIFVPLAYIWGVGKL